MLKIIKDRKNVKLIEILLQCKVDLQKNFYLQEKGNKSLKMNDGNCHYIPKQSNVQRKSKKLQKIRRKK